MAQLKPVSFAAPTEYSAEEESIKRQQALAQYLRQQADQPLPQGQMVSGWYVPSSPLEGLAKGLRSFGAPRGERGGKNLSPPPPSRCAESPGHRADEFPFADVSAIADVSIDEPDRTEKAACHWTFRD